MIQTADATALFGAYGPVLQAVVHLLTIVSMIYGAYRIFFRRTSPAEQTPVDRSSPPESRRQQRNSTVSAFSTVSSPANRLEILLNSGLTRETPLPRRVAVRCTNFVAAAMVCFSIGWSLLSLILWPNATQLVFLHLFCFMAFCGALLLSQAQRLDAARFLLLFFGIVYYCIIATAVGPRAGVEFYVLIAACVPPLIFEKTERRKIYLAYAALAFAACTVAYLQHSGLLESWIEWEPGQVVIGYYLSVAGTTVIVCAVVQFFMSSALTNFAELELETGNAERLLRDLLPDAVIERIRRGDSCIAATPQEATVLIGYLTGLSSYANRLAPTHMLEVVDRVFGEFDRILDEMNVSKVNTFGNAYLAAVGLFEESRQMEINAVALAALRMVQVGNQAARDLGLDFQVRIGVCTGQAIAGLIGRPRRSLGIWGETIQIAKAIDSGGEGSCIRVSESSYHRLRRDFHFGPPEPKTVPGIGVVNSYVLIGPLLSNQIPAGYPGEGAPVKARSFAAAS